MIEQDVVAAFNTRQTVNPNNIKTMTPAQQDAVKTWGSQAENLLANKDLGIFIHAFKFEICDTMAEITGHTEQDNARRVALTNQLAGIDQFVATLKRAVYYKNRVVNLQAGVKDGTAPDPTI